MQKFETSLHSFQDSSAFQQNVNFQVNRAGRRNILKKKCNTFFIPLKPGQTNIIITKQNENIYI